MSTIISTVLIASPPAFLAGWVLSKVLLRSLAAGEQLRADTDAPHVTASTSKLPEAATSANPSADLSQDDHDRKLVNQLRQELAAAKTGLQPLQTELQLLKEAGAERQQLVVDLKRKLQLQATLPEETPATGTARYRQLLQVMKGRLESGEQRIAELTDELNQAEEKGRRKIGGTGLGLAICKDIIEQHKGKIWVHSEPKKGTTFYFTIPIPDISKGGV